MAGDEDTLSYNELAKPGILVPDWVEATIANDVPRTILVGRPPLDSRDRETLARLLRALARWDPELAYCQGMNYITRFAFLSGGVQGTVPKSTVGSAHCGEAVPAPECYEPHEADAFWLIACLMWRYGARGLYLQRTPLLKLYSFCLSRLLEERLPEVHSCMDGLDGVLGFKWFGTLFTTVLPQEVAVRAWDLLFEDGLPALLCIALGLCMLLAPTIQAARKEGEEAAEVLGRLQRQLPADVTPLLPRGQAPPQGTSAGRGGTPPQAAGQARLVAERLLEAADMHRCCPGELEPLLLAWRQECPQDAADLGESFTFLSTAEPPVVTKL